MAPATPLSDSLAGGLPGDSLCIQTASEMLYTPSTYLVRANSGSTTNRQTFADSILEHSFYMWSVPYSPVCRG